MKELLLYMAKNLVDDPDSVTVTETEDEEGKVLELHVAEGDMGKVIGRQGLPICPLSLFGVPVKAGLIKLTQEATLRLFE